MSSTAILAGLANALACGDVRVVDLTQTLSEDTPLLVLPWTARDDWSGFMIS